MATEVRDMPRDPAARERSAHLIDPNNYVGNGWVEEQVRKILGKIPALKNQRQPLTDKFNDYMNMWENSPDQNKILYHGNYGVNVPRLQKVVENHVDRLTEGTFPSNDLWDMLPRPGDRAAMAQRQLNRVVMEHMLEQMGFNSRWPLFVRYFLITGTMVLRYGWRTKTTTNYRTRPVLPEGVEFGSKEANAFQQQLAANNEPLTRVEAKEVVQYEGATVRAVDMRRFWVHPVTAQTIEDAEFTVEEFDMSLDELRDKERAGEFKGAIAWLDTLGRTLQEQADADKTAGTITDQDRQETLDQLELASEIIPSGKVPLQEIFCKLQLYRGEQRRIDCRITVIAGTNIIIDIRQNPFPDQEAPYLVARVRERQDNFYGKGLVDDLEPLSLVANAFLNMGLDLMTFQSSPLVVMEKMKLHTRFEDIKIAPLARILVKNTIKSPDEAISFIRPPAIGQEALQQAGFFFQLMENEGGAQAITQGRFAGGRTTATEVQGVMAAAGTFTTGQLQRLEADILTPMLSKLHMLYQLWLSPDAFEQITGASKVDEPTQAIVGDYDYQWKVNAGLTQKASAMQVLQAIEQLLGAGGAQTQGGPQPAGGPVAEGIAQLAGTVQGQ